MTMLTDEVAIITGAKGTTGLAIVPLPACEGTRAAFQFLSPLALPIRKTKEAR